ncbi:5761_t:CDS:2 [Entrophospora sp. SA101]|nr:5761_t:CDS:2 [Entrophospora sp. SA101]
MAEDDDLFEYSEDNDLFEYGEEEEGEDQNEKEDESLVDTTRLVRWCFGM